MMPADVMALVANVCGVAVADMQSHTRDRSAVNARTITVMLLIEESVCNTEIRKLFPLLGRVSVLYVCRYRFDELITSDKQFQRLYLACIGCYCEAIGDY